MRRSRHTVLVQDGDGRMYGPTGFDGKPVQRTKYEYPYSYDLFCVYGTRPEWNNKQARPNRGSVYSDRLRQWSEDPGSLQRPNPLHGKWDAAWNSPNVIALAGNRSTHWCRGQPDVMQEFLRCYFDDPELQLTLIMEGANNATGETYWYYEVLFGRRELWDPQAAKEKIHG